MCVHAFLTLMLIGPQTQEHFPNWTYQRCKAQQQWRKKWSLHSIYLAKGALYSSIYIQLPLHPGTRWLPLPIHSYNHPSLPPTSAISVNHITSPIDCIFLLHFLWLPASSVVILCLSESILPKRIFFSLFYCLLLVMLLVKR